MSKWTKEPPTEPGWYFWKVKDTAPATWVMNIDLYYNTQLRRQHLTIMGSTLSAEALKTVEQVGGYWYSKRIEEPE